MELYFATSNSGKVNDAQAILAETDAVVEQVAAEMMEPQDLDLEQVAELKVEQALEQTQLFGSHLLADDSGLFVDALDGFPGILSSPFDAHVGKEKLLQLLDEEDSRAAEFRAATALHDPETGEIEVFTGRCRGELVAPRGSEGFGYDPMFVPDGHEKTFAEDPDYKHQVSHRKKALEGVRDWLQER